MKRIYEEYLHVPEDGKIRDKVFIARIAVAIVCMVCCLSAMGFSAYAYFTSSITSGSNTIVAATFNAEIAVVENKKDGTSETLEELELNTKASDMVHTFQLASEDNGGKKYTVTIKASETTTAKTGYCKIEILGVDSEVVFEYFTIPIDVEKTADAPLVFEIECYESATVRITANWGSCSEKDELKIGYNGVNKLITIGNPTSGTSDDTSDNESQKTPATTPNTSSGSETSSAGGNTTTDSKAETQSSTSTSGEGTENSDSSGATSNASLDDQDADDTTADGVSDETSNGEIDDGSGETVQDENVIE